jgi:hypothetical protein
MQLDVSGDARGGDLRRTLGGLALIENDKRDKTGVGSTGEYYDFFGGSPE